MKQTTKTLAQLAEYIGAKLYGDTDIIIEGVATLQDAAPGQLSFLHNVRYRSALQNTKASAVILPPEHLSDCPSNALVINNPYFAYSRVAALFYPQEKPKPGIHSSVLIGEGCVISPSASIAANCVIGRGVTLADHVIIGAACVIGDDCQIGEGTELYPNVTLYDRTIIGKNGIVHSGAVLGADGYGITQERGKWHRVPQLGRVIIGDDVDIGANTTIDRGALGDTIIGDDVKLDNQIQIGHNVQIGAHTAIAGCTGIAGSTKIGSYCLIGGGSCINGHIEIADRTAITGMSMITHSISTSGIYSSGTGMQTNREWRKMVSRLRQLDSMTKRLRRLEKSLNLEKLDSEVSKDEY